MADLPFDTPADAAARENALNIRRSILVEAPAGSGKTDLLTRRFLRLLATVDEPEEILAVTFTRAATAEMRSRILADLEAAAGHRKFGPDEMRRMPLAVEALAHAQERGWDLLNHPQRLAIETIDSLCLRIAHDRPLLANLGGHLQPTEDAGPLYALAARRTLGHLGGSDAALDDALAHLLDLRDNRLDSCEELLAEMLSVRDQWQHAFPLSGAMTEDDWDMVRSHLEKPFRDEVSRVLSEAHRILNHQPAVVEQLFQLAHYACAQGNESLAALTGIDALSPALSRQHWLCLCDLLLTKSEWRKTVNVHQGFPVNNKEERQHKESMLRLLEWLQHVPQLLAALCAVRDLPPPAYSEDQWMTLRHLFTVLRAAVGELKVVFAEENSVDFTEVSLAALDVLSSSPESALAIGGSVRHLLVDEFQDTSRRQHELVVALLAAWEAGEHRTVFLVGDPMQSIYMFRQAEVELFSHVRDHGLGPLGAVRPGDHRIACDLVRLSVNFRSHGGLTAPINKMFRAICDGETPPGSAAVSFAPATATAAAPTGESLHIYPQILGTTDRHATPADKLEAQQQEAREVLGILERHLPRIERARASDAEYRVAVLVRSRTHLAQIVPLLRENGIPFRAVEIERLADRQELLDLLSLTRALLHPMDRIAWLAVLRAPWCGLTLADLHALTGSDDAAARHLPIMELIERALSDPDRHRLSADGRQRLARTTAILRRALDLRWRQSESPSFASWIERTWRTLGGPACLDAAAYENAQVFFSLLDAVAPDGRNFDVGFDRLFAQPDPAVSERCGIQLMTIHKAKGLGFDVVIVPGLDRKASNDGNPLICSLERIRPWRSGSEAPGDSEFLVAPLGLQGEDTHPLYRWVRRQRQIRLDEERKRLFYVACTRARRELHLLGTAAASASGVNPTAGSLLQTAWPALYSAFESASRQAAVAPASGRVLAFPEPGTEAAQPGILPAIAAVADAAPRLTLRRLVLDSEPIAGAENVTVSVSIAPGQPEERAFRRPHGSRPARLVGSVVHTLLQRLGQEAERPPRELDAAQLRAHTAALLRAAALSGEPLASAAEAVMQMLLACTADPVCQWILAEHLDAQSEVSWTGFVPGEAGARLRTLRADRVFRAGATPRAEGSDYLWVIDYKTGTAPSGDRQAFLQAERALYAPQLLAYARALRALHGPDTLLRAGLYYPTITVLDFWDPGEGDCDEG
jgi:ATP-dependent exoDNAse (exonuclease V) beta subunit